MGENGYCGIDGATTSAHESCYLPSSEGYETTCLNYCNSDSQCKGYTIVQKDKVCRIHTTSSCPNGFSKKNKGKVGNLVNRPYVGSTCFEKRAGNVLFKCQMRLIDI